MIRSDVLGDGAAAGEAHQVGLAPLLSDHLGVLVGEIAETGCGRQPPAALHDGDGASAGQPMKFPRVGVDHQPTRWPVVHGQAWQHDNRGAVLADPDERVPLPQEADLEFVLVDHRSDQSRQPNITSPLDSVGSTADSSSPSTFRLWSEPDLIPTLSQTTNGSSRAGRCNRGSGFWSRLLMSKTGSTDDRVVGSGLSVP